MIMLMMTKMAIVRNVKMMKMVMKMLMKQCR